MGRILECHVIRVDRVEVGGTDWEICAHTMDENKQEFVMPISRKDLRRLAPNLWDVEVLGAVQLEPRYFAPPGYFEEIHLPRSWPEPFPLGDEVWAAF